jgi:hypothetical protein
MLRRILLATIIAAAFISPALAKSDPAPCPGCATPEQVKKLLEWQQKQSPELTQPIPATAPIPAPVVTPAQTPAPVIQPVPLGQVVDVTPTPPATQNTITTTGPVSSETSISIGTLAGQVLSWIMVTFSAPIGGLAVWIMVRVLKNLGITATDAMRARLQDLVVNGLNASAPAVQADLANKGQVEIKNAAVAKTIAYVQAHGADTIKALGLDPTSPAAIEAIKARIETAILDPAVPTPAVLDPVKPAVAPVPPPQPQGVAT